MRLRSILGTKIQAYLNLYLSAGGAQSLNNACRWLTQSSSPEFCKTKPSATRRSSAKRTHNDQRESLVTFSHCSCGWGRTRGEQDEMGLLLHILLPALVAIVYSVEQGALRIPLPHDGGLMQAPAPGTFPPKFSRLDDFLGSVSNNKVTLLHNLPHITRLFEEQDGGAMIDAVETVAAAPDGTLGLVDKRGRVFVVAPDAGDDGADPYAKARPRQVAQLQGGYPLGAAFDADGRSLLVCVAPRGLVRVSPPDNSDDDDAAWLVETLASTISDASPTHAGEAIVFAEDVAVDPADGDSTIYFTTGTDVAPTVGGDVMAPIVVAFTRGTPRGLLLAYDARTRETRVVADGFMFANGLALAHDFSFAVVADTLGFCVRRVWLKGARAGEVNTLVDDLPGHPDGISLAADGESFWVAVVGAPPGAVRLSGSRTLRALMAWAPAWAKPKPQPLGLILRVSAATGEVLQALVDARGEAVHGVTAATQVGGALLLGSLENEFVVRVPIGS